MIGGVKVPRTSTQFEGGSRRSFEKFIRDRGGTHHPTNLVLAHERCNTSAKAKSIAEKVWMAIRKRSPKHAT